MWRKLTKAELKARAKWRLRKLRIPTKRKPK
jgi:hypothetical protein